MKDHYFAALNHRSSVNEATVVFVGQIFILPFLENDLLIAWFVKATFQRKGKTAMLLCAIKKLYLCSSKCRRGFFFFFFYKGSIIP